MGTKRTESGTSVRLSTGQTVELPLVTEASMYGAVFPAPREQVERFLPHGIQPIRATPGGKAAVTLLSVEYHRIGVDGIEPYDEFGVLFPAVHGSERTVPFVSALYRATNGYVWYLPVTSEPARALGVEAWGYPKEVATITHEDEGSVRRTTVSVEGERFVTMSVQKPPSVRVPLNGYSYTLVDGELRFVPVDVDAAVGCWPYSGRVSVNLGSHRRAERLEDFDLGGRAIARIALEGEACFHPAEPLTGN